MRVHISGHSEYAAHSTPMQHFMRGFVIPVFELLERQGVPIDDRLQLSFDERHLPQSAPKERVAGFFGALLPNGAGLLAAAPIGARTLRMSPFNNATFCSASSRIAELAALRLGVTPRTKRAIRITQVLRRHPRAIENALELSSGLSATSQWLGLEFIAVRLEEKAMKDQVSLLAHTDIIVGMHGSGLALTTFMPARSLVIEVLPPKFFYCLQSNCFAHGEMIWVQLATITSDKLSKGALRKSRERPVTVNVSQVRDLIEHAWMGSMAEAFNLSHTQPCSNVSLARWLRHALPTGRSPNIPPMLGCQGLAHWKQGTRVWPACVSGIRIGSSWA